MTAKPVLNSSVCVSTMLNNVPVVVTGAHMGNVGLIEEFTSFSSCCSHLCQSCCSDSYSFRLIYQTVSG